MRGAWLSALLGVLMLGAVACQEKVPPPEKPEPGVSYLVDANFRSQP